MSVYSSRDFSECLRTFHIKRSGKSQLQVLTAHRWQPVGEQREKDVVRGRDSEGSVGQMGACRNVRWGRLRLKPGPLRWRGQPRQGTRWAAHRAPGVWRENRAPGNQPLMTFGCPPRWNAELGAGPGLGPRTRSLPLGSTLEVEPTRAVKLGPRVPVKCHVPSTSCPRSQGPALSSMAAPQGHMPPARPTSSHFCVSENGSHGSSAGRM